MARKIFGACAVGMFAAILTGCGTMASLGGSEFPKIYGGVQFDTEMMQTIKSGEKDIVKSLSLVYAADVPFSFMADTVALPITVTAAIVSSLIDAPAADTEKQPPPNQMTPVRVYGGVGP